jgi:hypothetical protein
VVHDGGLPPVDDLDSVTYNPVRILGVIGLLGVLFALAVGVGLVVARVSAGSQPRPVGVLAVYWRWCLVPWASVSLPWAAPSTTWSRCFTSSQSGKDYSRPMFNPSIDHYFGWIGLVALVRSSIAGSMAWASMGGNDPLWLYLLGSALFILIGVQPIIYLILMRVLEEPKPTR